MYCHVAVTVTDPDGCREKSKFSRIIVDPTDPMKTSLACLWEPWER